MGTASAACTIWSGLVVTVAAILVIILVANQNEGRLKLSTDFYGCNDTNVCTADYDVSGGGCHSYPLANETVCNSICLSNYGASGTNGLCDGAGVCRASGCLGNCGTFNISYTKCPTLPLASNAILGLNSSYLVMYSYCYGGCVYELHDLSHDGSFLSYFNYMATNYHAPSPQAGWVGVDQSTNYLNELCANVILTTPHNIGGCFQSEYTYNTYTGYPVCLYWFSCTNWLVQNGTAPLRKRDLLERRDRIEPHRMEAHDGPEFDRPRKHHGQHQATTAKVEEKPHHQKKQKQQQKHVRGGGG